MFLQTASGPLYFEVSGEGPPIVFVSGWAMSCECWRPAVRLLQRTHRCLMYDQRGVARSQPVSVNATFTLDDHADDLHRVIQAADVFDAAIVAHDLGAMYAAGLARAHPQDVDSLVITSPRPGLAPDDVKSLAVLTPASLALRELASYPMIRNLVQRRFRRAPQPYRDRLFTDFAQLSPRAAYETALSASSPEGVESLERLLTKGRARVLLICGDKDKRGSTEARRLFKLAVTAKIATMRDCGFLPMLEYPSQFAKLIREAARAGGSAGRKPAVFERVE